MSTPAEAIFENLSTLEAIELLIAEGEVEHQYLECKAPRTPSLDRGLRQQLGEAASGFANSGGGVMLWGVETTKHSDGSDVLTQLAPLGAIRRFARHVDDRLPQVARLMRSGPPTRVLTESARATRGVAVTFIPGTLGDPVQSLVDSHFYLRSGDAFVRLPYDALRRMFTGAAAVDLHVEVPLSIAQRTPESGVWRIPILLMNASTTAAHNLTASVALKNPEALTVFNVELFRDVSNINPGRILFMKHHDGAVYKGLNVVVGTVVAQPVGRLRKVRLAVSLFADRMEPRVWQVDLSLGRSIKLDRLEGPTAPE